MLLNICKWILKYVIVATLLIDTKILLTNASIRNSHTKNEENDFHLFDGNSNFHEEDHFQKEKDFTKNNEDLLHFHKNGFCDCNSQGPWRPLFKPSQLLEPDDHHQLYHHDLSNSLEDHNHVDDFGTSPEAHYNSDPELLQEHAAVTHSGERHGKKQNHMIHLHLIPHIYVPIVHPVSYAVHEDPEQDHGVGGSELPVDENIHPDLQSPENGYLNSGEHTGLEEGYPHLQHHNGFLHSAEQLNFDQNHENNIIPPSHHSYSEVLHHDQSYFSIPTASTLLSSNNGNNDEQFNVVSLNDDNNNEIIHSSQLLNHPDVFHNPFVNPIQQYQVHEENSLNAYQNFLPTDFNGNSHLLAAGTSGKIVKVKANDLGKNRKQKMNIDRSKYGKRYFDLSANSRSLSFMRPPPLGQKQTWIQHLPVKHFIKTNTDNSKSILEAALKPFLERKSAVINEKKLSNRNSQLLPPTATQLGSKRTDKSRKLIVTPTKKDWPINHLEN